MVRKNSVFHNTDIFIRKSEVEILPNPIENAFGETKGIYFVGEPYKGKQTKSFAYLAFPKTEMPKGGYPAVIVAHGGGGGAFLEWVEYWNSKGYAAIAPDFYGHQFSSIKSPDREQNPFGVPTMQAGSFADEANGYKESWTYHAVANCICCVNVLRDSGKVNMQKLGMVGISWGSVVTAIVSGVDERIKSVALVYGGGYVYETPFFENEIGYRPRGMDSAWIDVYDPSSYLPYNDKPTLFTHGANDTAFSPVNNLRSGELCQGKVYYAIKQSLLHDHRWRDDDEMSHIAKFFNFTLLGEDMPFLVENSVFGGERLTAEVKNAKNVKEAKLVYTLADLSTDSRTWEWQSEKAAYAGGKFTAAVPKNATAFFMQFADDTNLLTQFIQSTKLIRRNYESI